MKEVKLPSGRLLKVQVAPFADSKALYMALLEEAKGLKLDPHAEVDANFFKDIFCVGFSSKKIEACINKCSERALIDDSKISPDSFEQVEHRDDYITTIFEIAQENIQPFMKSLSASFGNIARMIQSDRA